MIKRQVARWLVVGFITNGLLYLAYLALTVRLLEPRAAMTVVYIAGVIMGFVGHRSWSFGHSGRIDSALLRYVAAYAVGYLINLLGLEVGVSVFGMPHQLVQATLVAVVAVVMFLMLKFVVFPESRPAGTVSTGKRP